LDRLVAAGRFGQKSGAGFYSYAAGPRGADDPALEAILAVCRIDGRDISQQEMTERLMFPMVLEASRCLQEKIVRDPADVDMAMLLGTGFPAFRGGLLRWADSVGLASLLEQLQRYANLGRRFEPTNLVRELAAKGQTFLRDAT
jgi:3-hydroxyacyl-CoA dehydrogenase